MYIANPHYEMMGGKDGVKRLVDAFYGIMDSDPSMATIRKLHPEDLGSSKEKLFLFLSGWLGGPQLYAEKYGHPKLRQRHLPFPIGNQERDQWMFCMTAALHQCHISTPLRTELISSFFKVATFLINPSE